MTAISRFQSLAAGLVLSATAATGIAMAQPETNTLAEVNGEPVTERELDLLISQQTQGRDDVPPAQRRQFLEEAINLMLLSQAGEAQGLDDDPDLTAQLNNSRRTAMAQAFVRELTTREPVAEATLRERYEAEYGGEAPKEYRARHILVGEAEQAAGIIEQLNDGEAFEDLARQYSQDGSAQNGGDLGWFAGSDMVEPFADAVAGMAPGEVSATPVETRFGFHVIRLDDTRAAEVPGFEDVAGQLRMNVINERIQSQLDSLRGDADIDYRAEWAE
ncbi:peptidylprolyl isomerase [Spiribacter pallidus]|uniref:peptidylprolyl isomerase n=1 Tax=Spiribacter pallidus TaxID=1987936 RepID=A0ABV3TCT3_9GAMM